MLTQAEINLKYAQAQDRRLLRLEADNQALRELIETLRMHLKQSK